MSKQIPANPDARLVGAFIAAGDSFVSGNDLASLLGISRPAVWARLQRLEATGFQFEAVRNKGHRLLKQPSVLHPALLDYWACSRNLDLSFLYFPTIDSTNTEAERQFQQGRAAPFAIASSEQTAGRGRRGRTWISESAENLYLTLALEPNMSPQLLSGLTLWAGIHLARGLNGHYLCSKKTTVATREIELKWPNDLEWEGRKLGGLLTEAKSDSDGIRQLVIGLGLNVGLRPHLERGVALADITGKQAICLNRLAVDCVRWLTDAYAALLAGQDCNGLALADAYAPLDRLRGKDVQAFRHRESLIGEACGIDQRGALLLRQVNGEVVAIDAGEVTLQAGGIS